MRPRKKDRHLPMCMFQRGPSFYFVRDGKWTNLGRDYRAALLEYAKLTGGASKDGMIDLIDRVMDHIAPYRSANTITQYRAVAERLKGMFAEFQPREVLPKHVAQVKTHMASTPNMANRTLTVLRVVFAQALEWGKWTRILALGSSLTLRRSAAATSTTRSCYPFSTTAASTCGASSNLPTSPVSGSVMFCRSSSMT